MGIRAKLFILFKSSRPVNLAMMMLSLLLLRYCLIIPAYQVIYNYTNTFPSHLSKIDFTLIIFAVLLTATLGYYLNDFHDYYIDEKNKPGTNKIRTIFTKKSIQTFYVIGLIINILLGCYLAIKINKPIMGAIFPFSLFTLWHYNHTLKKITWVGNITIAFLSFLVVLTPALFEPDYYTNIAFTLIYALFAFFISWIRELVKDIEDIAGDTIGQRKTLPVVYGIKFSKSIAILLCIVLMAFISMVHYFYFYKNQVFSMWNMLAFFLIPVVALIYLIYSANTSQDARFAQLFCKYYMLIGILSLIPFYYFFIK
ncbi:MAG: hypothetical protein RIQ89_2233 [Bacteroidota bacterium]|jgi:4-hydroxybenzoate polyprenyltransferase